MSRPTRRLALALTGLAVAASMTGCMSGNGPNSAVAKVYSPGDGTLVDTPDIRLLNVLVVAAPEGGASAVVSMGVANRSQSQQTLASVSVDGTAGELTGPVDLAPGASLTVGGPANETQVTVPAEVAKPGTSVRVQVRFSGAGNVGVDAPVYRPDGYYQGFIAPGASPTGVPSGSPSPTEVPTPNTTGGPSADPDPSAGDDRPAPDSPVTVSPTVAPSAG